VLIMAKMAIMDIFSDFQVYIEEDQDIREVFCHFALCSSKIYVDVYFYVRSNSLSSAKIDGR